MKKKFLMMVFFFAFMVIGVQSINAQYVQPVQAMNLLQSELQVIEQNPIYSGSQENHPQFEYLSTKHDFYTVVYEQLVVGNPVGTAIELVLAENNNVTADHQQVGVNSDQGDLTPIHQEIVDLLEQ